MFTDSEFRAYAFIKENLETLGWDTLNPARNASGQVYTQNECLHNPEIKRFLGARRPENIVKVSESILWIIEAKARHEELNKAVREARDRSKQISQSKKLSAPFISGVAGNDTDGYLVETRYQSENRFQVITINGRPVTALISPDIAKTVLETGHRIADVPVDEALFLVKAELINEHLHLGAINKNLRAKVMAVLLLALLDESPLDIEKTTPTTLISDINTRARNILAENGKGEFFPHVKLN